MPRPKILTYLKEGKSVGSHKGFAATFNWLVNFCANLSGDGIGVSVDRRNQDFPCIRFIGGGSSGAGGYSTPEGRTDYMPTVFEIDRENMLLRFKGRRCVWKDGLLDSVSDEVEDMSSVPLVAHSEVGA